jgi:hypothetical protein
MSWHRAITDYCNTLHYTAGRLYVVVSITLTSEIGLREMRGAVVLDVVSCLVAM